MKKNRENKRRKLLIRGFNVTWRGNLSTSKCAVKNFLSIFSSLIFFTSKICLGQIKSFTTYLKNTHATADFLDPYHLQCPSIYMPGELQTEQNECQNMCSGCISINKTLRLHLLEETLCDGIINFSSSHKK